MPVPRAKPAKIATATMKRIRHRRPIGPKVPQVPFIAQSGLTGGISGEAREESQIDVS